MRAIRVEAFGGPEVMRLVEVARPEPGPGEALVRIEASGVNFIDTYVRSGQYQTPLPVTLGDEAAGVVEALGSGVEVEGIVVGARVAYAGVRGAYAEYAVVPAQRLALAPEGVETQVAAAVMLQGMTAHYLATSTYPLQPGDVALVHAGGGGLGQLLIQVAKMRGAYVIATAGSEEKAGLATESGADAVILYRQVDFEQEVKRLTNGVGAHVVYDSVGKDTFDKGLNCLRPRGYMVLLGQSSGAVAPINPQVLNAKGSLFLTRPTLGSYVAERAELLERAEALFGWIAAGKLRVRVDRTFALAEAAEAHRYLEGRQTKGKVLLMP